MAAKFFTGLPLDGPDPECVRGHGERRWPPPGTSRRPGRHRITPAARGPVPVTIGTRRPPARACDESPLAGFTSRAGDQEPALAASGPPGAGRVALVTGAARGIGAATVLALASDGWSVLAFDRAADDPDLPYPMASPANLDGVVRQAERTAGACAGSPSSAATCATTRRWRLRWPRRSGGGAGWTRRSPRPG